MGLNNFRIYHRLLYSVVKMKPQESQMISELSELQSLVSELKAGFSSALLELGHIQQEDARLREDLERTRQHCDRESLQLRALVYSLKTDLQEVRSQICQLHQDRRKPQQGDGGKGSGLTQTQNNRCVCQDCGGSQNDSKAPSSTQPASLLLHCYLQGLRAGLCPITENPVSSQALSGVGRSAPFLRTPCNTNTLLDSSPEAKRQQVVLDLFQSEQEYLSTLFQLFDQYKTLSALPKNPGTCQMFVDYLEQLSQHSLLFRNALEDRLRSKHWQGLVGDVFARLTCQNEGTLMGIYLGYVRMLPIALSIFHQSNGIMHTPQDSLQEKEELRQVSQLLAPVSRIHRYLSHIQDLLQWTGRDHPDHYWLQVSKRALQNFLNQCHVILEQEGPEGDVEKAECSSPAPPVCTLTPSCRCNTGSKTLIPSEHCEPTSATNRSDPDKNSHSANSIPASTRPGSRCSNPHGSVRKRHGAGSIPNPSPPPQPPPGDRRLPWGAVDPGGEGRGSSPVRPPPSGTGAQGPGSNDPRRSFEDCDTDLDDLGDTSVFDYSSVTSCSPDGTLQMRGQDAGEGGLPEEEEDEDEEEEEEDSQVPVLLKPTAAETRPVPWLMRGEGSERLGVQVSRGPPHPPPGKPRTLSAGHATPGPKSRNGTEISGALNISHHQPPQRETTFREHKMITGRTSSGTPSDPRSPQGKGGLRSLLGVAFSRPRRSSPLVRGNAGVWEDSEDSDEPCSTV